MEDVSSILLSIHCWGGTSKLLSVGVWRRKVHLCDKGLLYSEPASRGSGCGWQGRMLTQPLGLLRPPLKLRLACSAGGQEREFPSFLSWQPVV